MEDIMSFKVIFEGKLYKAYAHLLRAQACLVVIDACYTLLCPKSANTKMYSKPYQSLKLQLETTEKVIEDYIFNN